MSRHVSPVRKKARSQQISETVWTLLLRVLHPVISMLEGWQQQAWVWLAAHPKRCRVMMSSVVVVLLGWSVWSCIQPAPAQVVMAAPAAVLAVEPLAASTSVVREEDAVLLVVAAYNQASISAGQTIRGDLLQPYLVPNSPIWTAVTTEFARRVQRGETADAELVRWGVVAQEMTATEATLTTREVWNVTTAVGGTIIASRRGTITQTTYYLRRNAQALGRWLLTDAQTTVLVA